MSFVNPQPCPTPVNFEGICCPELCLSDGTPILIVFSNGVESGWVNLLTGVFTPGPPPAGSGPCPVNVLYDYAEDSPHVSGDFGAFVLAVRNDTATVLTSANGDYSPIATDSAGRIGIADLGGSITVDGTVTVTQGTSPWVSSLDAATLAALESITVQNPGGAAAVNIQDGGNSITVDGTVTVTQGTSPWVVSGTVTSDSNFDYPEDSPHISGDPGAFVLAVRNDAAAVRTSLDGDYSPISTDSAGRVGISDLGGSITVDGTVTTSSDKSEDVPHVSGDTGSFALAVRNDTATTLTSADGDYSPIATDSAGRIGISDLGGSITVDGTVTANLGTVDGLALDTTVNPIRNRFSPSIGSPVSVAATGNTVVYTPAAGMRIRLKWVGLSSPSSNTVTNLVDVILGGVTIYKWDMGFPGAFAHGTVREGPVNGTLSVTTSNSQVLRVNFDLEEF